MYEFPTPMHAENAYKRELENEISFSAEELKKHERRAGFSYRQAIGELIYAIVKCRPDISFPIIKLAQYFTKPSGIFLKKYIDI